MNSSMIEIITVKEVQSDGYWSSGRIWWLSISIKFGQRKRRSIAEFVLLVLLAYQVSICWLGHDNLRSKESAISNRESLWIEWKE